MKHTVVGLIALFLFLGCVVKQPKVSQSATVIFKTPNMKFYDKGFIAFHEEYISLQVFNVGKVVLDLKIYQDKICKGTFECLSNKEFNSKYLSESYEDDFMVKLLNKKKIYFKDKKNNILIKIKKD